MLGLAGVGNLLQPYGSGLRYFSGMLSFLFIFLLIGRIITDASGVLQEINNPVIASVAPCFSMRIILLAGYLTPFTPEIAELIWYSGIILHFIFVIIFSYKYLMNFEIKVGFCPGYSAFTFPFVITALGLRLTGEHIFQEYGFKFLQIPVRFIEILALALVVFVLLLYLREIIFSSFNLSSRKKIFNKPIYGDRLFNSNEKLFCCLLG